MTLTPAQRSLRARIGAHALHAQRDPRETTSVARGKFLERFEREVDPAGELPLEERRRRAAAARRAYFTGLALRSSRKREAADFPRSTAPEEVRHAAHARITEG